MSKSRFFMHFQFSINVLGNSASHFLVMIMLISYVSIMIQIKIGIGSVTFSNMGPMRGQYVFLTTKIRNIFFLHSILLFWAMYM